MQRCKTGSLKIVGVTLHQSVCVNINVSPHIYTHKYNQCIYTKQTDIYINMYICQIKKSLLFKAKNGGGTKKLKKQYIGAKIESQSCVELKSAHSGVRGGSVEHLVGQGLH